jgi:hypothetical protein
MLSLEQQHKVLKENKIGSLESFDPEEKFQNLLLDLQKRL